MTPVRHTASTRQHLGQHCKQSCSMEAVPSPDVQRCNLGHQHSTYPSACREGLQCFAPQHSCTQRRWEHPSIAPVEQEDIALLFREPLQPQRGGRGAQCLVPKPPNWLSVSFQHGEGPTSTNTSGFQSTARIQMLMKPRNNPSTRPTQLLCRLHLF